MLYYVLKADGKTRKYSKSIAELRKHIFQWLAFQKGNMEMGIHIFTEDGGIAEKCYLNYGAGNRCYFFRQVSTGKYERTYRSYHPAEEKMVPYIMFEKPIDIDWMEIPTLKGRQVLATGGWIE